jgi:OOP family OmpA-OmpF porin
MARRLLALLVDLEQGEESMRRIHALLFAAIIAAPGVAAADTTPDKAEFNLFFGFDSTALDATNRAQVQSAVAWLENHPDEQLVIEGHADAVGDAAYNKKLACQRAKSVANELMDAGASEDQLIVYTLGEKRPLSERDAGNRRVRIYAP